MNALTFAVVLPALLVAHSVGDHWVQTDHQAAVKGQRGWSGRRACVAHVASYTVTTAAAVALLWWVLDLRITLLGFVVGQLVSAVSHYLADRRTPLARLAQLAPVRRFYRLGVPRSLIALTQCGEQVQLYEPGVPARPVQWDNPSLGTGAYALDQSWHWAWLLVAALVTAVIA